MCDEETVLSYHVVPGDQIQVFRLCPLQPTEPSPRLHHHNLMKLVTDVIIIKNSGPRWDSGYFRQDTVVTQAQDGRVSVTVDLLAMPGARLWTSHL